MENILLSNAAAITLLFPISRADTQAFFIYPLSQEVDPALAGDSAILSFTVTTTHDPTPLSVAGIFPSGLKYDNDDGFFEAPDIFGLLPRLFMQICIDDHKNFESRISFTPDLIDLFSCIVTD